jgi:pimeloyl-ACP methyl ester carboxylesterase
MRDTVRVVSLLAAALAAGRPSPAANLPLQACDLPGVTGGARCGTLVVPEDRAKPRGATIPLRVVVLPATGADRAADALVYFAGGPGASSVEEGADFVQEVSALRRRHDVVLVDMRGTGGSGALTCAELTGEHGVQTFLDEFLPASGVRSCRDALRAHDLAQYRTAPAVDDVSEAVAALGYRQVDLIGASYGTRAALVFLRRHPSQVRTVTLMGVVPPDARLPLTFARDADDALAATFRACAADAPCAAAFPHLHEELMQVLARLEREPVNVTVPGTGNGGQETVRLTRQGFAQSLRYMLYVPGLAVEAPLDVHAAAAGNFAPIAAVAVRFARMATGMSDGYFLSVTCAEDVPFIDDAAAATATQGTFLGDFRIRAQREACRSWGVPAVPRAELAPVVASVPALLLSGERDPVTPARWGEAVASHLAGAVHVVIPDGGHSPAGLRGVDCVTDLVTRFVESGDARGLDRSCVRRMGRPPFATALPAPEVALDAAQRARLVGRYAGGGLEVTIAEADGRLRLAVAGEGDGYAMLAQSPVRFGFAGMPATNALEAIEEGGRVTAVRLLGIGEEPLVLRRVEGAAAH